MAGSTKEQVHRSSRLIRGVIFFLLLMKFLEAWGRRNEK